MTGLLDEEAFAAAVAAATHKAGFQVEQRTGLILTIAVHGQSMRCDLKMAYAAYRQSPHRLNDIIDMHLAALRQAPPPPALPTEQEALESLLPILNPAAWLSALRDPKISLPVHRPFVAGLVVTYVFDLPQHRAYLSEELLSRLSSSGESLDAIHALALDNLRKRTTRRHTQAFGMGAKTILACEVKDGYAATRVLLPDMMATWAERLPGRMLIGVPNRDFLIAFGDRDPQHVAAIAKQVRHDAKHRDHPLTAELLVWQDGRIRERDPRH